MNLILQENEGMMTNKPNQTTVPKGTADRVIKTLLFCLLTLTEIFTVTLLNRICMHIFHPLSKIEQ